MNVSSDGLDARRHLGDFAELYALGALEPSQRAAVEAHVAGCATCARALDAAVATVAALDDAFVPRIDPPDRLGERIASSAASIVPLAPHTARGRARYAAGGLAAAAALVIGVGGGAFMERATNIRQAARQSAVLATIATSHFAHVTFTRRSGDAPVSKVLYAHDGAWLYVIVDSATCGCRVVARSAAGNRDLGDVEAAGGTATLFARGVGQPNSLDLVDAAGRVIADAKLINSPTR